MTVKVIALIPGICSYCQGAIYLDSSNKIYHARPVCLSFVLEMAARNAPYLGNGKLYPVTSDTPKKSDAN